MFWAAFFNWRKFGREIAVFVAVILIGAFLVDKWRCLSHLFLNLGLEGSNSHNWKLFSKFLYSRQYRSLAEDRVKTCSSGNLDLKKVALKRGSLILNSYPRMSFA